MTSQIRVTDKVKSELEDLKVHPRETYDDVIKRLTGFWKNTEYFLSPMDEGMIAGIKHGLGSKFGVPVTEVEDLGKEGTAFHLEGKPKGTPVLIPRM